MSWSPGIHDQEGVCNDHGKCVCPNFFGFEKDKSKKCVWQESCNHCSKNAICENGKCSCVRGYTGKDFKSFHFGLFLILIGSNKSKWTIAQKRSLKQNHWTWDSNIWSWKGNGKTCENLNECETKTHDCKEPAICHDLDGTYDCKCPRGYRRHTTVSWLPQNGLRMMWIRL